MFLYRHSFFDQMAAASLENENLQRCLFPVIKPPCSIPPEYPSRHQVTILHPAYNSPGNVLLVLSATDHPSGAIHHETALVACGIVADNRWDGYFTKNKNGPRIDLESNGLLIQGQYYFHVPGVLGLFHFLAKITRSADTRQKPPFPLNILLCLNSANGPSPITTYPRFGLQITLCLW